MDYWQFDLLAVALPALVLAPSLRPARTVVLATLALAAVALAWTAPWDEHLVRTGVWSYGPDRVLAVVGRVPLEEYAFVVLLVGLVAAWGTRCGLLVPPPARPVAARPVTRPLRLSRVSSSAGAVGWLGVTVAGAGLAGVGGPVRYLGLLLLWAGPPLALQHAVAGDLLARRRRARLLLVVPVALWLAAADRLAIAAGIWTVAPGSSTGVLLLGLPVEEALFFLLAAALVGDGLLLATDPRALARARGSLVAVVAAAQPSRVSAKRAKWGTVKATVPRCSL